MEQWGAQHKTNRRWWQSTLVLGCIFELRRSCLHQLGVAYSPASAWIKACKEPMPNLWITEANYLDTLRQSGVRTATQDQHDIVTLVSKDV
jgi:hypothetical protein